MERYSHLEKKKDLNKAWKNGLLKKYLPVKFFTNSLVATLVLSIDRIIIEQIKMVGTLKEYKKLNF